MKRLRQRHILTIAIASALCAGTSAHAQTTTPDPGHDEAVQLDAVTITAQRREEQMQKTPVTISAFSATELERKQVSRIEDLKYDVPNITIQQNTATSSGAKIFLRGVGQDESLFTADPAVAIYIDDVYIPRQNGSMFDLYDVERIEVLRGPQGTLYGRNATGGAIRYITRKPKGDERFSIDGTIGNFGRTDARVMYNTRVGESLDVSASLLSRHRDGYTHEQVSDTMVNDSNVLAGRVGLSMPVAESSYATLSIDRLHERSGPAYPVPIARIDGETVPRLDDLYTTRSDLVDGRNELDQFGLAATFETYYDRMLWRHIAHYRNMDALIHVDVDGTDQMRYHMMQDQTQSQRGYETQLISQYEGPFNWVGGVFAFNEKNVQPTRSDIFVTGGINDIRQDTTALAAYMQATYAFTGRTTLTAGGRYSHEEKDFSVVATRADGSPNFEVRKKQSWAKPDWKLMLDHDFSDDVMGFVSASTGFKSGGFNGRGSTADTVTTIDEETVLSYEAGLKTTLLDNRLRLNATVYRNDYGGLQLSAVDRNGVFVVTNATGALIQGIELELQAQLTRAWQLSGSVGTIDAEYKDYSEANRATFEGVDLKHAPKHQWQIGSTYVQALAGAQLVWSAQAARTAKYYQNQEASELHATPAHTQINARIAYEPGGDAPWSVAVWGRNLGDEQVSAGGFDIAGLGIAVMYPSMPRTYGVEFKYRFW